MEACKFCNREFKNLRSSSSHEVLCVDNPNRKDKRYSVPRINSSETKNKNNTSAQCQICTKTFNSLNGLNMHHKMIHSGTYKHNPRKTGMVAWNKGLTKETDDRIKRGSDTLKESWKNGLINTSYLTCPVYLKKLSDAAKRIGCGGYKKNAGRSKKFKYIDSFGVEVTLQSSYELICAELLDSMKIKWNRPGPLKYNHKKYFPDFLLVDYGIYLDPKNDYLAKIDKPKIDSVCDQNNVIVHILTKNMLNPETISNLIKHVCPELVKGPG